MRVAQIFLLLQALVLGGFGVAYFIYPQEMANLTGMVLLQSAAIVDVRAYYGALQLGIAVFLLSSALRPSFQRPALSLMTLLFAALALGRLAGLYLEGTVGQSFNFYALGYEAASAVLAYLALRLLERQPG